MQADLWAQYDEASVYGREVLTLGGRRRPAHAYFVPLLSGMQLWVPVPEGRALNDALASEHQRVYAAEGGDFPASASGLAVLPESGLSESLLSATGG